MKKGSVSSTPPRVKPKTSSIEEEESPTSVGVEITSDNNRATIAVTRYLPSKLSVTDETKIYLVILEKFYALSHKFKVILEVAVNWFLKAETPDSTVDAKGVYVTMYDSLDEAMQAAQNAGAIQHVPVEKAPEVNIAAVSALKPPASVADLQKAAMSFPPHSSGTSGIVR
jgi:hypothetical protein